MIGHLLQPDLEPMVRARKWDQLHEFLAELAPADVAEIIEYMLDLPGADEAILFRLLPRDQAGSVFAHLPLHRQRKLVQSFSSTDCSALLNEMSPDDRTRLLEEMPAEVTKRLL